jgi:hypothetical protein
MGPDFPVEVWSLVSQDLEPDDLSRCRLVNRAFTAWATAHLFKTFVFEFSEKRIQQLAKVASSESLGVYVQSLVHQRGRELGLRGFSSRSDFEDHLMLPSTSTHNDQNNGYHASDEGGDSSLMAHEEWIHLTPTEKESWYSKYEHERKTLQSTSMRRGLINKFKPHWKSSPTSRNLSMALSFLRNIARLIDGNG